MHLPTNRRPKSRLRSTWVLLGGLGAVLLWAVAEWGLAWQVLPGLPGGQHERLAALLAPRGPVGGNPEAGPAAPGEAKHPIAPARQPEAGREPAAPMHPLIQALLDTLDAFHGEGADAKDALRDRLEDAGRQLRPLLRDRKEKILQANRKVVLPLIEERVGPAPSAAKKIAPQSPSDKPTSPTPSKPQAPAASSPIGPTAERTKSSRSAGPSKPSGGPSQPEEARTALVRALLETLDAMPSDISEEEKRSLRKMLLDADQDLANALETGGKKAPPQQPTPPPQPPAP